MIISRYLRREVLETLVGVTLVLLLIFISQQLVRYLGYAASGKIAPSVLFQVIGFQIPWLLALLLPPGLFFAVLLTFGRLYADNELRILHSCGYSIWRLTGLVCVTSGLVAVIVGILILWVNPLIAANRQQALAQGSIDNLLDTLMPGRFKVMQGDSRVVYVEKISRDHRRASNIFFAEQKQPKEGVTESDVPAWTVIAADAGYQQTDPKTGAIFIVAENGYRYEGVPGQMNYRVIRFEQYRLRVPDLHDMISFRGEEAVPTKKLFEDYQNPDRAAELQWRLSIAISVIILALLAVPLSEVKPRKSRYTALLPALLIYVIYMNLLMVSRHFVEQKMLPVSIGLWWVHGVFLVAACLYIFLRAKRA